VRSCRWSEHELRRSLSAKERFASPSRSAGSQLICNRRASHSVAVGPGDRTLHNCWLPDDPEASATACSVDALQVRTATHADEL
jgi:hypothetical protein